MLRAFYVRYLETEAELDSMASKSDEKVMPSNGYLVVYLHSLVNFLSDESAPGNTLIARLMTRRFAKSLLLHQEHEMDIASLLHMTGYQQVPVVMVR